MRYKIYLASCIIFPQSMAFLAKKIFIIMSKQMAI